MRLLAFILGILVTFASFGTDCADSVNVYFRVGYRHFEPSLGDNRREMDRFINQVREAAAKGDIEQIVVRAYASPDGSSKANEILASRRCDAIADYIVANTGISTDLIRKIPEGISWDSLKRMVEESADIPSRRAVLDILNNTPVWVFDTNGKIISGRKSRLMMLDRGIPYRWMEKHLFPKLRNAVAVTMQIKNKGISEVAPSEPLLPDLPETVEPSDQSESQPIENLGEDTLADATPVSTPDIPGRQRFALKTNLLYDAILMPNIEFEWLINKKWSVSLEGDVAWWKFSFERIYRLAVISPEVRYHIRPKSDWRGMYVGLFAGGGLYQLENGGPGYRGEGGMAGVSFGYMWPIGKYLSLDAEIGAGYMGTRYKVYENRDSHKLYMRTKTLNYFGPLKLKLSIAWRFDFMKKN
ncbi:MAG: DUF3575 domain-containing protein [Muribaculaceae bacterium]|nr:DUF3575 domain-containing protein [Muribaculaceae bacterium]